MHLSGGLRPALARTKVPWRSILAGRRYWPARDWPAPALAGPDNCLVRRVSVIGVSGSGKTTLAAHIARRLGAAHLELDSVFHQHDWQPLAAEEFRARVEAFTAGDTWVIDGSYQTVIDLVWARADAVVWLDLPRRVTMQRIIWRTLRRTLLRQELWNGNREPWSNFFRADPEKSMIAWAWRQHHANRARYAQAVANPPHAHLTFVTLRSRREVAAFAARVGPE